MIAVLKLVIRKTEQKPKAEMNYELANAKRARKQEEKAKLQEEKQAKKKDSGKRRVCPTCKGADHSRSSNKQCPFYKPKRRHATELKRTSIIKTTLKNICKEEQFVNAVQKPIEHVRDITYVGSLFANFFFLSLLEQEKPIPPMSHDLVYALFTTIAGQGCKAPESVETAFKTFKSQILAFDAKRFRSKGFMTLISQAAQEYEENVRNHITEIWLRKPKSTSLFVSQTRMTDSSSLLRFRRRRLWQVMFAQCWRWNLATRSTYPSS
ncbi:hypothetical protein VTP01DRAFT_10143 [Rhizomucor pusillus]|uniref:uncharacterized protein n=1 Tax=Rhizomucor pusillus TaxID=4840 RepID=UPI0037448633